MMMLVLLAGLLLADSAAAKATAYTVGAAPAWVTPVAPLLAARKAGGAVNGVEALLSDVQERIDATGRTTFRHFANRATTSKGISSVAGISTVFDPTYQSLVLHRVDIIRDGRAIDKLKTADIRVLQREEELESQLYDGNQTVNVAIDDVRIGDVVEYAYSISGMNPVFQNIAASGSYLQWGVPVDRVFLRVLAPATRKLVIRELNMTTRAIVSEANGYREHRWDQVSVPAMIVEKNAPADYDPYAQVDWSEFADWAAVSAWAVPLYAPPSKVGADLRRVIEQIRAAHTGAEARLLAVLRVVQRDIRYLGIEVGPGSHAPTHPDVVIKRRFGDCKDKAMLVLTMLAALGVDAHAALVNSQGSLKADAIAAPHGFNHVIVRATIDKKHYWLDPTMGEQQGDLAHIYQPDYGLALVLHGATSGLSVMAPTANGRTVVSNVIDASKGFDAPASLQVTTVYTGLMAQRMRDRTAAKDLKDKAKEYLDFYARTYPGISEAAPLAIKDDARTNTFTMTESYSIKQFWASSKGGKRLEATFESDVNSRLTVPDTLSRKAPLAVAQPDEMDETFELLLPENWEIEADKHQVSDPAFDYRLSIEPSNDGRKVIYRYHYKAKADRVAAADVARYAENIRSARETVGRSLYWNFNDDAETADSSEPVDWRIQFATLAFSVWVMFWILWLTTPREHRRADGHLLTSFVATTAVFTLLAAVIGSRDAVLFGAFACMAVMAHAMVAVGRWAPATHWSHHVANPGQSTRPSLARGSAFCLGVLRGGALVIAVGYGYRVVTAVRITG